MAIRPERRCIFSGAILVVCIERTNLDKQCNVRTLFVAIVAIISAGRTDQNSIVSVPPI